MSSLWLIRRDKFTILGPYDSGTIEGLLSSGGLSSLDELCRGDDDWFVLKDQMQFQKYFHGLKVQYHPGDSSLGVTQTFDITKLDVNSSHSMLEAKKGEFPPRIDRVSGQRTIRQFILWVAALIVVLLGMSFFYFFR